MRYVQPEIGGGRQYAVQSGGIASGMDNNGLQSDNDDIIL
jgi:hypothetical protein